VPVDQKADLRLMLEAELDDGGKKEHARAAMVGPDVAYYIAQPDAVRLSPPVVTGLKPAAPFQVSASIPVLPPANAKVEVVAVVAKKLRVTPSVASPLAAGVWARMLQTHTSLGFAAPRLYAMYGSTAGTETTMVPPTRPYGGFHDILVGANGAYSALPGYDYVTGLGSFDVGQTNALIGQ